MLALTFEELPKLQAMLRHIEDNSAAFGAILMFLAKTGIPPEHIDQFQVILMDLVAERFGLSDAVGSYKGYKEALGDMEHECLQDEEYEAAHHIHDLDLLVDRFLNNIPR
jgi:hypothetical protein